VRTYANSYRYIGWYCKVYSHVTGQDILLVFVILFIDSRHTLHMV